VRTKETGVGNNLTLGVGNYLIAPLGNYLTLQGLRLRNYLIADTVRTREVQFDRHADLHDPTHAGRSAASGSQQELTDTPSHDSSRPLVVVGAQAPHVMPVGSGVASTMLSRASMRR